MQLLQGAGRLLLASLLLSLISPVPAKPSDDVQRLLVNTDKAGQVLDDSLSPKVSSMNTSAIVMALVHQVGAARSNLDDTSINSPNATRAYYPLTNGTNTTTASGSPDTDSADFDKTYYDYANSLLALAESITLRGQIPHHEYNLPVYNALQGLGMAIHAYGLACRDAGFISVRSMIRTNTAGSSIAGAMGMWDDSGSFSGKRR